MSDTVWIALIVAGSILIIFFSLLIFFPKSLERLLGRVHSVDANAEGLSITFFKEQAQKAAERKGGNAPEAPLGLYLKGVSVLWVDDVPENNFHEAAMFEALGADVRFSRDNASALVSAQKLTPSLIVSDIHRHGELESGLDLPSIFSEADQELPPVVYYTGSKADETASNGHPITIHPGELFSEAFRLLENGK
ncbi:MAG: hypothetical protein AAF098_17245 [Pseudomonadota bacterium]